MRFRRRFASVGLISRLLRALDRRFGRTSPIDPTAATDRAASGPGGTAGSGPATDISGQRTLLARLSSVPVFSQLDRRFALTAGGVLLGALVFGYLLAALVFFPAPIFASSRSVPRVVGMEEQTARERLEAERLRVGNVSHEAHPTAPAGVVIWQDPPSGLVAPEATEVALAVSNGPRRVPVPDVAGYEAQHARLLIESSGLRVERTESAQAPTPRNVVVNTRPTAGTTLLPGSSVTLVVSVGAATIRVPALDGLTIEEARLALETAGLALGTWFAQTTNQRAPGEIFYQDPSAGTLSAPGTAVTVRVARGGQ